MRGRALLVLTAVAALVGACTSPDAAPELAPASGSDGQDREAKATRGLEGFIALTTHRGIDLVDVRTAEPIHELPGAVASPDWSTLFQATGDGATTTLDRIDPATGETAGSAEIPGDLEIATVSSDGYVALTPTSPDAWQPREQTRIVVVDAGSSGTWPVHRFDLHGNFEPEAFSFDGESLFMLRYRPALAPISYRVTNLHLGSGRVRPVYGPTKAAKVVENMTATRVHQATSPDQGVLYTLYTNQPPEFLSGVSDVDPEHALAFIHTLDLWNGTAVCIGLPVSVGRVLPEASALAVSPLGSAVYAIDVRGGTIAAMTGERFKISEHDVDLSRLGRGPITARVSADGSSLFVAGSRGLLALDTTSFVPSSFARSPRPVTGLAMSASGDGLFASWTGEIVMLDPITLGTVSVLASPAPGAVAFVGAA